MNIFKRAEQNAQLKAGPYASIVLVVIALLTIGLFAILPEKKTSPENIAQVLSKEETADEYCQFRRVLDGVCVATESEVNPKLAAIMIENHHEARPQAGLSEASIVYEAPVEGNIPRFLAIFPITTSTNSEAIGPVRSAREYYLDWVREYGTPYYLHVGGSPEALNHIKTYDINDVNEFYFGDIYFWRSPERAAPHNTYTSSIMLSTLAEKRTEQYTNDTFAGWAFAPQLACTDDTCITDVEINFGGYGYDVRWTYDREKNHYLRSHGTDPHRDVNHNQRIIADTIIIQHVTTKVYDDYGRLTMTDIGSGMVQVIQAGKELRGTWKKDSGAARTVWLDEDGHEITLNPGKIWIEVVNGVTEIEVQ